MILRECDDDVELLFIERAHHEGDPWSGQIAFPGGGVESTNAGPLEAACRETAEEVGVLLNPLDCIGRLDDHESHPLSNNTTLVISCFAFVLNKPSDLIPNYEVADAFWFSAKELFQEQNQFIYQSDYRPAPYEATRLTNNRVLWGLTYRFVQNFRAVVNL